MSPVQGLVRLRRHQFGRQTVHGTPVAAKRAYPFSGTPSVDPTWTDPEIDVGSIDIVAAPYRGIPEYTASLTDPSLRYNSIPLFMSGFFGGAVTGTGSPAVTRMYNPASTSVDAIDLFTYEFGDDVLTDWYQLGDGILESVEINGPEGLGALDTSMSWRFGKAQGSGFTDFPDSPVVPTSLDIEPNETIVYLKDGAIFIASDPYDLAYESAKVSDALHSFVLRFSREIDEKRYANGDQSFDVDAYAVASRSIELECTFAKTADTVGIGSESDAWFSDQSVDRYIRLYFESTQDADTGVPYSWDLSMPMRYYTREEGEVGGNTVIVLTAHAFYDPTAPSIGVFSSELVNTLPNASL